MERKKAFAIAGAATALVGGGIVAVAALSDASVLGFGGSASAQAAAASVQVAPRPAAKERLVVRTRDVYDRVVVETTTPGTAARVSDPSAGATVTDPEPTTTPTTVGGTTHHAGEPGRSDDDAGTGTGTGAGVSHTTSTTASPAADDPTTTTPTTTTPTTTTTRGPEIPDDWPAGKPIPPIPPNCHEPELHLNGVWECSGSGD